MKRYYQGLDLIRFILVFGVLIIHFRPFKELNYYLDLATAQGLSRVAVPFYFMVAGYFFAKSGIQWDKTKSLILKYGKIYLIWTLVYLPINLFWILGSRNGLGNAILYYFRDVFFQGSFIHLWYLPGSMVAFFLVYLFNTRIGLKNSLILAFILYFVGVFGDGYAGFIHYGTPLYQPLKTYLAIFASTRNGLFFGFMFMQLGVWVFQTEPKLNFFKKHGLTLFIVGLVLMGLELTFIRRFSTPYDYNMYFSLIPATFFLFMGALNLKLKNTTVYGHLSKMASNMYFSHMALYYGILILSNFPKAFESGLVRYGIGTSISVIICGLLEYKAYTKQKSL